MESTDKTGLKSSPGPRREFGTGSVRDNADGKGLPHLLPWRAINLAALQMERGAAKYGKNNWRKGQPLSSYFDSAFRHLTKHQMGWTDEPHLDAFVWNALVYAETAECIRLGILPKELDDRPVSAMATPDEQGLPTVVVGRLGDPNLVDVLVKNMNTGGSVNKDYYVPPERCRPNRIIPDVAPEEFRSSLRQCSCGGTD